ncbi:MAG: metallophosphoesterase [Anaerolineaceae bacterium]|nr:metallophosphoesterase [Anaerolineaceae bacterium]
MKIQVVSDLHSEFFASTEQAIEAAVRILPSDALIVAGDIGNYETFPLALQLLARRYYDANSDGRMIYIMGNHEFYLSPSALEVTALAAEVCKSVRISWLNNAVETIQDQRLVGSTLWYPFTANFKMVSDSRYLPGETIWEQNRLSKTFLEEAVQPGDIVITHHTPLGLLTDSRMSGEIFDFSGTNLLKLMAERRPRLWIFGHQHSTYDFTVYATRLVCNPYGYHDHILNETYQADFSLSV